MMELEKEGGAKWKEQILYDKESELVIAEKNLPCYAHAYSTQMQGNPRLYSIQIPFHGFRIPGTEFQSLMVEVGFRTTIVGEIPDSKAHGSGFHRQSFPRFLIPRAILLGFWNPDSLTWGDQYLALH